EGRRSSVPPFPPLADELEKVFELHRDQRRRVVVLADGDGPASGRACIDRLPHRRAHVGAVVVLRLDPEARHLDVRGLLARAVLEPTTNAGVGHDFAEPPHELALERRALPPRARAAHARTSRTKWACRPRRFASRSSRSMPSVTLSP